MNTQAGNSPSAQGADNKNILSISNLKHIYPNGVKALDGLDLNIPYGMYGLLGPNGAGKSSFMRILATLQQPTSGQILFENTDILKDPAQIRKVLGYLPQEFGVYPGVSAEKLLNHIAVLKGIGPSSLRMDQIHNVLQKTNLFDVRNRKVSTFSGGMKQRFGIAQALLGNPRLLIIDEPTSGLDPAERSRFHDLLAEIGEEIVIILSTHILEDVAQLCPRLAIMMNGRVVAEGETSSLVSSLQGRIWSKPVSREELADLKQSMNVLSTRHKEGKIIAHVLGDQIPAKGFRLEDADLQDFYLTKINAA